VTVIIPAVLLALAVVFFVLQPIVSGQSASMTEADDEMTEAQHLKRVALLSLRDVEYDYHAGKLDDEDYHRLKREISAEALAAIDAEEKEWQASEGARRQRGPGEEEDELAITVEAEIAALRESIREGMVCPQCGYPNARGSRFCGDCGSALPGGTRTPGDT